MRVRRRFSHPVDTSGGWQAMQPTGGVRSTAATLQPHHDTTSHTPYEIAHRGKWCGTTIPPQAEADAPRCTKVGLQGDRLTAVGHAGVMKNGCGVDGEDDVGGSASGARPERRATSRIHRALPQQGWLRLWNVGEAALRDFFYLVMPAECAVCGMEDQALCPECAAEIRRQTATPFRAESTADALMGVSGEAHLPVVAAGKYRDALSAAILAFKNHGRTELGPALSRGLARSLDVALAQALGTAPSSETAIWLVPVPSTGSGWRRRGYDPVALLLRTLVREGRLPAGAVVAPILGIRATITGRRRHQKGLGRSARRRNVRNTMKIKARGLSSFLLPAKPDGQRAVLIDDVLTTGSTLREAAQTLGNSGLQVVAAVVLAAANAPDHGRAISSVEGLAEN